MNRGQSRWTDAELQASINVYRRMWLAEQRNQPYSKKPIVDELVRTLDRSKASIEMRFQNISAVLDDEDVPWIDGYKPLRHYPSRLRQLLDSSLPWTVS